MTTLSVKILFFGEAQQLIGLREDTIETPINTDYEEIKRKVLEKFSALRKIENVLLLAINQEYASPAQTFQLDQFSEIAVIPPLSGG